MSLKIYDSLKPQGNFPAIEPEYFGIETDGTVYLKPEYRGATIDFATDSSILADLGASNCATLLSYAESDNGVGNEGSKINSLPEVLHIPNKISGLEVKYLAPAMFAYNKRVKQIVLPEGITTIPNECFAYAINLTEVKNIESVISVKYGSFFASGISELDLPELTSFSERAFMKSGHLKKIHLGKVKVISSRCFEHCTDLETITHDTNTDITTVGDGSFFNTTALKEVDFVSTLKKIGNYAFSCCALNFDWSTLSGVTFGKYATPLQMNPTLTSESYNIKAKSCRHNAPLRIDQENPEWVDEPINALETYKVGCAYFSVMNAYCGIRGLNCDNPKPLADINRAISIEIEELETMFDLSVMDSDTLYENYYGMIFKYIGATNSNYTQNHYYRVDRSKGVYYWLDLGTQTPTNLDLFMGNSGVKCFDEWIKGLGLKNTDNTFLTPSDYPKIIEALQNGSYVMLNVPRSWNAGNGHAIILHGVNSNGEVLFVNSSVPGKNAIGDYTAVAGSCPLQNLTYSANVSENGYFYQGSYVIISEGETKTLLNKTVDDKVADIYVLFMEAIEKMNMSVMKMDYKVITQTETVEGLTFSYDFEPKIVLFNTTATRSKLYNGYPELTTDISAINGIFNHAWVKENICDNQPMLSLRSVYQKISTTTNAASLTISTSNSVNQCLISVAKDETTGKWVLTIGGKDDSDAVINRILGGSDITYNLFVAG